MLTPEEEITIESYNRIAKGWTDRHNNPYFWEEETAIFQKYLPRGQILEVCTGGGRDVSRLMGIGFDYEGVDVSSKLVELAKSNNPDAKIRHVPYIYNLPYLADSFEGIWSSATLLHVPESKLPYALYEMRRVLRPNGVAFISIKEGSGKAILEEDIIDDQKMERFFWYYQEGEFATQLEDTRLEVLKVHHHPIGHTNWLGFFVRAKK